MPLHFECISNLCTCARHMKNVNVVDELHVEYPYKIYVYIVTQKTISMLTFFEKNGVLKVNCSEL